MSAPAVCGRRHINPESRWPSDDDDDDDDDDGEHDDAVSGRSQETHQDQPQL